MKSNLRWLLPLILLTLLGATPRVASAASPAFVVVRVGDSLYQIAGQFGTTPEAIVQANRLPSVNFIYAGQILLIPETFTDSPPRRS